MKVFISWSGPLSKEVAHLLKHHLSAIIQGLDVFFSPEDISSGSRWSEAIRKELEDSSFGIICLTAENKDKPWLLFEAGALTKQMEGSACALLLGDLSFSDVTGPLSQFQHAAFDKEGVRKLLGDINELIEKSLDAAQIDTLFDALWPNIEREYLQTIERVKLPRREEGDAKERSEREILDEILELARSGFRREDRGMLQRVLHAVGEERSTDEPSAIVPVEVRIRAAEDHHDSVVAWLQDQKLRFSVDDADTIHLPFASRAWADTYIQRLKTRFGDSATAMIDA